MVIQLAYRRLLSITPLLKPLAFRSTLTRVAPSIYCKNYQYQPSSINHSPVNQISHVPRRMMSGLENIKKEKIVPDVIDQVPSESVTVSYPSGAKVQQGNELTPTVVKDVPKIEYKSSPDQLYTVAMVDPDAPPRKEHRQWLHWLVVNVPGSGANVGQGKTLAQYVGSGPPKGTGLHRYVFLVYKQSSGPVKSDLQLTNTSADGREQFSIRDFAEKHNMGEPIAVNFYQAQWDDYVPTLYKQLGAA